jgi:signal transduction histidine kinase
VNQLLDFRKSVYQGMKLKATFSNLVEIIETNLDAFSFMAKEKSIEVQFIRENEELNGWFDIEKLNIILFNIFSNAFKFTPECGTVTVELKNGNTSSLSGKPHVELMISNSGKGIPKSQQEKVFERFYQVPDEANSIKHRYWNRTFAGKSAG